jgi:glutathione S-transferase
MKLIGMLDSPFVRRVAISLDLLHVSFEHESVSVFSTFARFQAINPVVKAPTLVCDDGTVLMDSSLILQFIEATHTRDASLWARDPVDLQHEIRAVGLALAACDKSVQIVYERNLRPAEVQYEPWMERVAGQLAAAYGALEQELARRPAAFAGPLHQAALTAAVAWQFTQSMLAHVVPAAQHPGLVALSKRLEDTDAFRKYPPVGPGVTFSA